jgi:predicted Co/Zn/Cd cation transporter (cation efflux family)
MSRRQKRVVFYSSPLIVLLVIVLLVKLKLDQIEANAQQLAQMGQTARRELCG